MARLSNLRVVAWLASNLRVVGELAAGGGAGGGGDVDGVDALADTLVGVVEDGDDVADGEGEVGFHFPFDQNVSFLLLCFIQLLFA